MTAPKKHLLIQLLEFAFANRARAKISCIILGVMAVIFVVAPSLYALAIGTVIGTVIGGVALGVGPYLGLILLIGLIVAGLRKIGGFSK